MYIRGTETERRCFQIIQMLQGKLKMTSNTFTSRECLLPYLFLRPHEPPAISCGKGLLHSVSLASDPVSSTRPVTRGSFSLHLAELLRFRFNSVSLSREP